MSFFDQAFEETEEHAGRSRVPRKVWLVLVVIVLLLAAAYVALHEQAGGRLPLGTKVQGVSLSGMKVADARAKLVSRLGSDPQRTLHFVHNGHDYSFVPARSGVSIDYATILRRAGAGSDRWSPGSLWSWLAAGDDVPASLMVQQPRFRDALQALANKVGRPAVQGTVDFRNGHAVPVFGHSGLAVDQHRMRTLIAKLIFDNHRTELPIHRQNAYVPRAAVRAAYRGFARTAMSGPVVLDFQGHRVVAPPRLFGKALSMIPQQGKLVPLVDGKTLMKALKPVLRKTIGPKPRDAKLVLRNGRPHIVPAVYGASYESNAIAAALPTVLRRRTNRVLHVHAAIVNPKRTTAEVKALGIDAEVASATVGEPSAVAAKLNGTMVHAGQQLKLSQLIGGSNRPVASALFQAALKAGLTIPSYTTAPAHDVKITPGQEMTDVTVQADRNAAVYITAASSGSAVTVRLWSTPDWRVAVQASKPTNIQKPPVASDQSAGCTPRPGVPGFERMLTRWRRSVYGGAPQRQTFRTTYRPIAGVSCGPASPSATPTPSG